MKSIPILNKKTLPALVGQYIVHSFISEDSEYIRFHTIWKVVGDKRRPTVRKVLTVNCLDTWTIVNTLVPIDVLCSNSWWVLAKDQAEFLILSISGTSTPENWLTISRRG